MTLPNFLIVGAQKAGTTSLYHYLNQHPDVFMSPAKEPHFFSFSGLELPEHMVDPHWTLTLEAYQHLFDGAGGEKAIGESSTSYLDSELAPRRIQRLLPEVKLIAVLRDPADRAHSHYVFNRKMLLDDAPTFSQALAREPERLAAGLGPRYLYAHRGLYHAQLSAYFRLFDRRQMRVFLFEDFKEHPSAMLREIFRFLGVDDRFEPDMAVKYNVSGMPRNKAVEAVLKRLSPLRHYLERTLPPRFVSRLGKAFIRPEKPAEDLRRDLVATFRDDILKLQDLIDRDLSAWLRA